MWPPQPAVVGTFTAADISGNCCQCAAELFSLGLALAVLDVRISGRMVISEGR